MAAALGSAACVLCTCCDEIRVSNCNRESLAKHWKRVFADPTRADLNALQSSGAGLYSMTCVGTLVMVELL